MQLSVPGLSLVTVSAGDGETATVCLSHNNGGMQLEPAREHNMKQSLSFFMRALIGTTINHEYYETYDVPCNR